jgi:pyruvate ferredoxin oxidoreductase gamma subunit
VRIITTRWLIAPDFFIYASFINSGVIFLSFPALFFLVRAYLFIFYRQYALGQLFGHNSCNLAISRFPNTSVAGGVAVLQIIIQGRGGQGAQMAGQILATAFFHEGKHVQAYATYGGARRGTAVSSFIRVDDQPVRLRCDIETPDAILCFDSSLLGENLLKGAVENTLILVNSTKSLDEFKSLGNYRIYTIDGKAIAHNNGLGRIVNSALLGAFACLLGSPNIENMGRVVEEMSPVKKEQNYNSCLEGYEVIKKYLAGQEGIAG